MRGTGAATFGAALLISSAALAGDSSGPSLGETRPGTKVRVTTVGPFETAAGPSVAGQVVGTLLAADQDAVTVLRRGEKDRVRIPRAAIRKLEVGNGGTRGRNALIGAGVGAAVGLTAALIEHSRCRGEFLCGVEFALPFLTTPLGALVGVATGGQRWVEASQPRVAVSAMPVRRGIRVACSVTF
jgi:hypothetical protein